MKIIKIVIAIITCFCMHANSQCKVNNIFFQAGEILSYDLYFKYGLLDMKAGTSSLSTSSQMYDGKDAYKITMLAASTGSARKIFSLNDTLTSYVSRDIVPLAFEKRAEEGGNYTYEKITYTYQPAGKISVRTLRIKDQKPRFDETLEANNCLYDMSSVVFYARTLDYMQMKSGDKKTVEFMSGRNRLNMIIEYKGEETIKGNDDKKYNCLKLVLSISDDAFVDSKEAMKVWITKDNNRMPVRLETKLKRGSTRAILKGYKGNRYPVE